MNPRPLLFSLLLILGVTDAYAVQLCPAGQTFKITGLNRLGSDANVQSPSIAGSFSDSAQLLPGTVNRAQVVTFTCPGGTQLITAAATLTATGPVYAQSGGWRRDYAGTGTGQNSCGDLSSTQTNNYTASFRVGGICEATPVCEEDVYHPQGRFVTSQAEADSSGDMCHGSCSYSPANTLHLRDVGPSGGDQWMVTYKTNGTSCIEPPPTDLEDMEEVVDNNGEEFQGVCTTSGDEIKCGVVNDASNCGFVNGEVKCLADIPDNSCVVTASGGAFCVGDAPDTGTPGEDADPDVQFGATDGDGNAYNTINWFNSTTVSNSTNYGEGGTPSPTPGPTPGDGGDDEGECDPDVEECEGEGGGDCEGDNCVGEFSGKGGTAKTFGESVASFKTAFGTTALGSALNGVASGAPAGSQSCTDPAIELWGEQLYFPMCWLLMDVAQWFRLLALLSWAIYALFRFMEA